MQIDSQAQAVLDQIATLNLHDYDTLDPERARKQFHDFYFKMFGTKAKLAPVENIRNKTISGGNGNIQIRIYEPESTFAVPIFIYFHGGGWLRGDLDIYDDFCRSISFQANCTVISVDYHLAPEYKFPVAIEDAYASLIWVSENVSKLNGVPGLVAVGGDSAGGNLAAVVSQMARDRDGPMPVYQLLVYPITNCDFDTRSYKENASGYFLTREKMITFWRQYLKRQVEGKNPYASPLLAQDLTKLPPAHIITAELDPLRDEGEAYAERLKSAGVSVSCTRYKGMIHGFVFMSPLIDAGRAAINESAMNLSFSFASVMNSKH